MVEQTEKQPVRDLAEDALASVAREPLGSELSVASAMAREEEQEHAAAIGGDPASVDKLWRRHRRWVAAILLAHKPRWADLDDLLQEVAVSLVRKISDVRDPRAVRPWLRTVAVNAAAAAARSGARRAKDVQRDDAAPELSRSASENEQEIAIGRHLLALAAEMPEGYREPLLLKAIHNLSYREIGQIMGLPETTIETRIARGRRQLRELAAAASIRPGPAEINIPAPTDPGARRIKV